MKTLIIAVSFALFLFSCSTFQPITSKNGPITNDVQSKISPGNTYMFSLRSGKDLIVRVEYVDSVNVYGTVLDKTKYAYHDTFQSVIVHSTKISVKKFSSGATLAAVVIPIGLIGLVGAASAMDGLQDIIK